MLVCMDNVDDVYAQQQLSQVPQWFERWESVFSRFRSNSELSVLNASAAKSLDLPALHYDEAAFRFALNEDAMATEKLAEGIRNFVADGRKLEALLQA